MTLELRPFQVGGVNFLQSRHGAYLADDCGLGKTVESLTAAKSKHGPILVLCRSTAKRQWADMIEQWDPDNAGIEICKQAGVYNPLTVLEWFRHPRKRGYLLMHHEALHRLDVKQQLQRFGIWEIVILDEAHYFRGRKARRTEQLSMVPSYNRWALSATPFREGPAEMWPVLNWMNAGAFPSYWAFRKRYENRVYLGKFAGLRSMSTFAENVGPYMLWRTKEEVAHELPPKQIIPVRIDLPPSYAELYNRVRHETFIDLMKYVQPDAPVDFTNAMFIENTLVRTVKLRQLALDPMLIGSEEPGVKFDWLWDFVHANNEPMLVFTHSRKYANLLAEAYPEFGLIAGNVKEASRQKTARDFMDGRLRGIIGTMATMSESLNLQRARISVFLDLDWSSIAVKQAEDRIHRINITQPVQIYRVLAVGTIDELMQRALERQWSTQKIVRAFVNTERRAL